MPSDALDLPLRELIDALPGGLVVCDGTGTMLLVNAETERMFGYARDELVGRRLELLMPELVWARGDGRIRFELAGRRKDGGVLSVELGLSPIDTARDLLIAGIRDVSELRELRRAHEAAEVANAAKRELLSSMGHELRTPLNAILGFAQLLERDRKEPLSERQQERLQYVLRGGEQLLRVIDDLLDLARLETGRIAIAPEPVALAEVLAEVVTALEPMAADAQIRLEPAAPAALPLVVADRTRLAQILTSFGSNAIKYGKRGGHVRFELDAGAARVRITVSDDGLGIPDDAGIGLAISKRLAELMNGAVGFASEAGRGSTFWVELPVHRTEERLAPTTTGA
jgi:PAS domain S-box-containing protein